MYQNFMFLASLKFSIEKIELMVKIGYNLPDTERSFIFMKRHLIAIDLDGTTLNNESQVDPLTVETLRYLHHLGHLVCIVTGRPYRNSKHIYQHIGLDTPIVNFNGALCHFPGREGWIPAYHHELDKEIAFELFANQDALEIDLLAAEGKDQLYTSSMNIPDSPFYPKDNAKIELLSRDSLTYNPTALTVFCATEKQETVAQKILDSYGEDISVRTWGGILPVLEIVRKNIHKALGVKTIADFYHIPIDHILAFGDENNDLEMLEFAGLGVAMANATDEIKSVANTITKESNNEQGLAKFLLDYFKLDPQEIQHHSL